MDVLKNFFQQPTKMKKHLYKWRSDQWNTFHRNVFPPSIVKYYINVICAKTFFVRLLIK
jgi:hypothetical protein